METKITGVFKDPEVTECLNSLHDTCVIVPAEKGPDNLLQSISCIKLYDFATLYTRMPHSKFNSLLKIFGSQ